MQNDYPYSEPYDDELDDYDEEEEDYIDEGEDETYIAPPVRVSPLQRSSYTDPTFVYIIGLALVLGLAPLTPANTDWRYALAWGLLGGFSVYTWLLGRMERIEKENSQDLLWGIVFGIILGTPLLFVGGNPLQTTVQLMFRTNIEGQLLPLPPATALMLLVFVMPLAETLFFRGLMQAHRPFWMVGIAASIWSVLLLFPTLNIREFPFIAVILGIALIMMNMLYSYVRARNGLAAAWLCQIVVNLILLFIPRLG